MVDIYGSVSRHGFLKCRAIIYLPARHTSSRSHFEATLLTITTTKLVTTSIYYLCIYYSLDTTQIISCSVNWPRCSHIIKHRGTTAVDGELLEFNFFWQAKWLIEKTKSGRTKIRPCAWLVMRWMEIESKFSQSCILRFYDDDDDWWFHQVKYTPTNLMEIMAIHKYYWSCTYIFKHRVGFLLVFSSTFDN